MKLSSFTLVFKLLRILESQSAERERGKGRERKAFTTYAINIIALTFIVSFFMYAYSQSFSLIKKKEKHIFSEMQVELARESFTK